MKGAYAAVIAGQPRSGGAEGVSLLHAAAALALLTAAMVDVPRLASLGPLSLMGAMAAAQAMFIVLGSLLCLSYPRRLIALVAPWLLFVLWGGARSAVEGASITAVQNGVVYLLFGGCMLVGGILVSASRDGTFRFLRRMMRWVDAIGLTLAAISLVSAAAGGEWVIGPRSFALVALVFLGWHLAMLHDRRPGAGWRAAAWMAAIVLSLSRTAIAVAVLQAALLLLFELRYARRQFITHMALLVPAAVVMGLLVTMVPALNQRFFAAEFNVIQIGGIAVSTSGRSNVWPAVIASGRRHPIVGQGWGSSQQVTASLWGPTEIGHPHNDYLRVWHDAGWIGIALFALALAVPAGALFRGARAHLRDRHSPPHGAMALAGLLALSGILLAAITDNAIVYSFVMSPLGLLIGAGIAAVHTGHGWAAPRPGAFR